MTCRSFDGVWKLINGKLYFDHSSSRFRILSFCLDDPKFSCRNTNIYGSGFIECRGGE